MSEKMKRIRKELLAGLIVLAAVLLPVRPQEVQAAGTTITQVSQGGYHSAAVDKNGNLWMWGSNNNGQLGDGTKTSRSRPVKVMTNVKAVSLGHMNSAAIRTDGSLWTWGWNNYGQLGDGTKTDRNKPVKIMTNVKAVSLGELHSAAVKTDGSLWMWGYNYGGCLGDGTETDRKRPVKVMTNVKAVSLGFLCNSAAVKTDGSLWVWGAGELGNGTYGSKRPVKVMTNVKAVSLGDGNYAVVKTDGSLWMWGGNYSGQLGDGTKTNKDRPVKIMTGVKEVSLGHWYSAAVKTDGSLWTWGDNDGGRLGDGTETDRKRPVKVMTNVKEVSLGVERSAAVRTDGSLWTWGNWALGNGSYGGSSKPVKIAINQKEKQAITVNKMITVKTYGKGETFNLGARAAGKLTYQSSNAKVAIVYASGVVKITGCGTAVITVNAAATTEYEAATETVQLTVEPDVQFISVTSGKKGYLTFKWGRNSLVNGYEINYSTSKAFSSAKRGTVSNNRTTEGERSGLVSGQIYYVRIRGYRLVNGVEIYGPWSAVKYCRVK